MDEDSCRMSNCIIDHIQKLGLNIFENRTAGNLPQNFLSLKTFIKITQTAGRKSGGGYWETTGLFSIASSHT
jgi:hypothetical protein